MRITLAALAVSAAVLLFSTAGSAAIVIDGSGFIQNVEPNIGISESRSPGADLPGFPEMVDTPLTVTYTGVDPTRHEALYFGVRSEDAFNFFSMNGTTIELDEVFRYSSHTANSITYTGATVLDYTIPRNNPSLPPLDADTPVDVRVTWTFTGPGAFVEDETTQDLNGPLGDVQVLWRVEGDFSVEISVEAVVPPFLSGAGSYELGNLLFNRASTADGTGRSRLSVDWTFYWTDIRPPETTPFIQLEEDAGALHAIWSSEDTGGASSANVTSLSVYSLFDNWSRDLASDGSLEGLGALHVDSTVGPVVSGRSVSFDDGDMAVLALDPVTGDNAAGWSGVVSQDGGAFNVDGALAIAGPDASDGMLVAGVFRDFTGSGMGAMLVESDDGAVRWGPSLVHGSDALGSDRALAAALAASGSTYLAGELANVGQGTDFAVAKLTTIGAIDPGWGQAVTSNGTADGDDGAKAIAVDASEDVVVAGVEVNTGTDEDFIVTRLASADGAELWKSVILADGEGDVGHWVAIQGSTVFAAGVASPAENDPTQVVVVALDSSTGGLLGAWNGGAPLLLGGPSQGVPTPPAVAIDSNGDLIVFGKMGDGATNDDLGVAKIDGANGSVLWRRSFIGTGTIALGAEDVAIDSADNIYAGYLYDLGSGTVELGVVKLSDEGFDYPLAVEEETGAVVPGPATVISLLGGSSVPLGVDLGLTPSGAGDVTARAYAVDADDASGLEILLGSSPPPSASDPVSIWEIEFTATGSGYSLNFGYDDLDLDPGVSESDLVIYRRAGAGAWIKLPTTVFEDNDIVIVDVLDPNGMYVLGLPTVGPLPGDANLDGWVDGADYTVWADHFGLTDAVGPSEGDFNGDAATDGTDFTIWANNYAPEQVNSGAAIADAGGGGAAASAIEDTGTVDSSVDPVPACGLGFELIVPLLGVLGMRRRLGLADFRRRFLRRS